MNVTEQIAAVVGQVEADIDTMRDVYMLPSQRAAYDRLIARLRAAEERAEAAEKDARRWKDDLSEVAHDLVSLLDFYGLRGELHETATAASDRALEVLAALAASEKGEG